MLDPVHHPGFCLATGAFKASPVQSLIVESGELPLSYRFKSVTICRALKIISGTTKIKDLFEKPDCFSNTTITQSSPKRYYNLINKDFNNFRFYDFNKMIHPWMINHPQICSKLCTLPVNKIDDPMAKNNMFFNI